jgi:hypothetical protein
MQLRNASLFDSFVPRGMLIALATIVPWRGNSAAALPDRLPVAANRSPSVDNGSVARFASPVAKSVLIDAA